MQERLARHRNPTTAFLQRRRDGRWVIVSERKTDEGGTVAVYSDVTELQAARGETLSAQNKCSGATFEPTPAKYLGHHRLRESIFQQS